MSNNNNNLVVFSDFGDDPDDGAAASEYLMKKYENIHIIVTTGDTEDRVKVFYHLFSEWFENGNLTHVDNGVFKNKHGTMIKIIAGNDSDRKMNVDVPNISKTCFKKWVENEE